MRSYADLSQKFVAGRCCRLPFTSCTHFHFAYEFFTRTLAHVLDSLVRVSRRVRRNHFGKIALAPQTISPFSVQPSIAGVLLLSFSGVSDLILPFGSEDSESPVMCAWQAFYVLHPSHTGPFRPCVTPKKFFSSASFSTISSLLTLFSKFFSSFLHSTCSLSVSHKYLALEEVYLPFRAAFPNNPTLRFRHTAKILLYGIITLFDPPFQGTYAYLMPSVFVFRLQF